MTSAVLGFQPTRVYLLLLSQVILKVGKIPAQVAVRVVWPYCCHFINKVYAILTESTQAFAHHYPEYLLMIENREISDAHATALRMGFVGTADALRAVFGKSMCYFSYTVDSLEEDQGAAVNIRSMASNVQQTVKLSLAFAQLQ